MASLLGELPDGRNPPYQCLPPSLSVILTHYPVPCLDSVSQYDASCVLDRQTQSYTGCSWTSLDLVG